MTLATITWIKESITYLSEWEIMIATDKAYPILFPNLFFFGFIYICEVILAVYLPKFTVNGIIF